MLHLTKLTSNDIDQTSAYLRTILLFVCQVNLIRKQCKTYKGQRAFVRAERIDPVRIGSIKRIDMGQAE